MFIKVLRTSKALRPCVNFPIKPQLGPIFKTMERHVHKAVADKKTFRKQAKEAINALSEDEKMRQSKTVIGKLCETPEYKESKSVALFLSMNDEVRTDSLLKKVFETQRSCYIPKYVGNNMEMVRLESMADYDSLPMTAWKIKQPADEDNTHKIARPGDIDVLVVPGLAFTTKGHRLGRGRGYYDRYINTLEDQRRTTNKPALIAIAFNEQIFPEVPTTECDMLVDMVLFEKTAET